jgi:DNA-binding CsgD family transcriptional regulator
VRTNLPAFGDGPTALVGRRDELARCGQLLASVATAGQAVLIEGDAGIGKSALADAVAAVAVEQKFRVLRCGGMESETTIGFAGLHELIHPLLDRLPTLPAGQRQALEVALGHSEGSQPNRLMIWLATLSLLEEYAAEQPALIVVEDAQWLDTSTAQAIAFVARRLSTVRLLLMITMRTDSAVGGLEPPEGGSAAVIRSVGMPTLLLGPLDQAASTELLRAGQPGIDDRELQLVLAQAAGNPLALVELGQVRTRVRNTVGASGEQWLPTTRRLEQAFLSGASQLPDRSRRLLLLIAAAPEASVGQLLAAGEREGLGSEDLAPIERARLAGVVDGKVVLRHPLVRSAVYGGATFAERTAAHRTLAEAADDPDRAAWHAAAAVADHDDSVAAALESSSARARARGAVTEAVAALRRSSAISSATSERARRLAMAAEIARQAGDVAAGALLVREADALAASPDVVAHLALTEVALTRTALVPGRSAEDLLALAERLGGPSGSDNPMQRLRVLATAATAHCVYGLPDDLRQRLRHAIDLASCAGGEAIAQVGRVLLFPEEYAVQTRPRLTELLRVVADGLLSTEVERWPSRPQMIIGVGLMADTLQDFAAALTCWNLGVDYFRRTGAPGDESWALQERAWARVIVGELRDGLADAELARQLSSDLGLRVVAADAALTAARAYSWSGDDARAVAAIAQSRSLAGGDDQPALKARASWAEGVVALNQHRYEDAWDALRTTQTHPAVSLLSIADLTEAAVRTGHPERSLPMLAAVSESATRFAGPYLDNLVQRSLALTAPGPEAEKYFELAVEGAERNPGALELARTQLMYGEWLRRSRRIVDAREHLEAALRTFDRAGAHLWTGRAAAELRAAGGTVARPAKAPGPPDGASDASGALTAQEQQIALLAAEGLTNREIADRIYVSHRTVGTHLHRIFPKLGITNRTQLQSALSRAQPPGT